MISLEVHPLSIYLHFPFCRHRCSYCDFNSYTDQEERIPDYIESLIEEIKFSSKTTPEKFAVHTIYFGGGTPSLIPIEGLEKVIGILNEVFSLLPDCEITLEANPGTLTLNYIYELRKLGVNRLSLGMQSAIPEDLHKLGRQHTPVDVIHAVKWARFVGIDNINLDLMFGIPYQTLKSWQKTLDFALNLSPSHLSLYSLTLEKGTPMADWVAHGLLSEPDPDIAADMYEYAMEALEAANYFHYEISNWAYPDQNGNPQTCQHNLQYWRSLPYLGFGAGAHGFMGLYRTVNVAHPDAYIKRIRDILSYPLKTSMPFPQTPATIERELLPSTTRKTEYMIMGLRLVREGVRKEDFLNRFEQSLMDVYGSSVEKLIRLGLVEWTGEGSSTALRLTQRGILLGNQVFFEFV